MDSWFEDPGVDHFRGVNLKDLKLDEAYLNVTSAALNSTSLYQLLGECYRCPFSLLTIINGLSNDTLFLDEDVYQRYRMLVVNTADHLTWRLIANQQNSTLSKSNNNGLICELQPQLGEFGVYQLDVNDTDCIFSTLKEPVDIDRPLWVILGALGVLWLIWSIYRGLSLVIQRRGRLDMLKSSGGLSNRLRSLDIFRGICVMGMILANDGMGGYKGGEHATWDGLRTADLAFPAFLWIMGAGVSLHTHVQLSRDTPKFTMLLHILRMYPRVTRLLQPLSSGHIDNVWRSCLLFLIGLALTTAFGPDLTHIRILGVLQRFAITYFVIGSLFVIFTPKHRPQPNGKLSAIFSDITGVGPQWIVTIILLGIHAAVTYLLPVPGCPRGYVGPGGMHEDWAHAECTGGSARKLDSLLLGDTHLYQKSPVMQVYRTSLAVEPEGLLGTLPAVATAMLGAQAGAALAAARAAARPARLRLALQALAGGLLGGALCGFSRGSDGLVPLNKHLWSLSFVLVPASMSAALLSALSVISDECGARWERAVPRWSGAPFVAAGRNALLLYVGHQLLYASFPWHWRIDPMNTHFLMLLECFTGALVWMIIAILMHRKKIYIRL